MLLAANPERLAETLERAMERVRQERGIKGEPLPYLSDAEDWD